jgi:hypothetical protein
MRKRKITKDIYADFVCDYCDKKESVIVDECIYNGAPYCTDCEDEMSLQYFYHKQENKNERKKIL